MKKITGWLIFFLVISGWALSGFQYLRHMERELAIEKEVAQLELAIISYRQMKNYVEESAKDIEGIIETLKELKENLDELQQKMEKGVQNESSQDRE